MNNGFPTLFLAITVLLVLLLVLLVRLIGIAIRRSGKPARPVTHGQDLLFDALKDKTLAEKEADLGRKQTVLAYEALDALHRNIMVQLPVGVLVLDAEARIQFANPYLMKLFDLIQVSGQPLSDLNDQLAQVFAEKKGKAEEFSLETQIHGQVCHLRLSINPLENETNLLTLVDETRERLLEEQLRSKRDLEFMGELAGGVTHEVKNTLATIRGLAQLIPYGDAVQTGQKLMDEVDRLSQFIKKFTASSKSHRVERERLNLADWFDELIAHWQVHPRAGQVHFATPDPQLVLLADATLAAMVINNLILNGLEACSASEPEPPWVTVSAEARANFLCIQVTDKGDGFPEHLRHKLFVPFVSSKENGSGLGLFHSRKVMLEHGGQLVVYPQGPTRVICQFPDEARLGLIAPTNQASNAAPLRT